MSTVSTLWLDIGLKWDTKIPINRMIKGRRLVWEYKATKQTAEIGKSV